MKILLNKYREGYRACTNDAFTIFDLDRKNPYIKDTIAWQNFRLGYRDCYSRSYINVSTEN